MAKKTTRPVTAIVESVTQLSPSFIRIVFSGPDMVQVGSEQQVFDQRIKLIFPTPGSALPTFPEDGEWYSNWLALPEDVRGSMRTYSIRELRQEPGSTRLSVDFVLHLEPGLTGPAATWASQARPGDKILMIAPLRDAEPMGGIEFHHGEAKSIVLAGDETAAPAIARILEDLKGQHLTGTAYIEVPTAADALEISGPQGIDVQWLPRDGRVHGEVLMERMGFVDKLPDAGSSADLVWETPAYSSAGEKLEQSTAKTGEYYWIAGESSVVTRIRRALVKDHGLARSQVAFMGYWKKGVAMKG